jgi:uncharacterized protein (DUF934 family)
MPLIKDGRVVEDTWLRLEDDAQPEPGTAVIVSLERWQAERETLAGRNAPLGLWLKSDQSPAGVAEDLGHFDLVALEFPKFNDGRAFSYGRLLRERYGFTGEVRAVGEILQDQLLFMHRCGFDAFAVAADDALDRWAAAIGEISVWYQPMADGRPFASSLRERRRAARPKGCSKTGETPADDSVPPGALAKPSAGTRSVAAAWAY